MPKALRVSREKVRAMWFGGGIFAVFKKETTNLGALPSELAIVVN